jgi:gliding motility-associated-like protein
MNLPHQLFGSGGVTYSWSPGSLLNNPNLKNPVAIISGDTKFVLTVSDNAGCTAKDTVLVKAYVGPAYYIPNAFTPNGDGLNDIFRAIPPGITKTEFFRIFNRWGQLLFETRQYLKGWDGTSVGKPQPEGSYVWQIRGIDKYGKIIEMKGTVVLIR